MEIRYSYLFKGETYSEDRIESWDMEGLRRFIAEVEEFLSVSAQKAIPDDDISIICAKDLLEFLEYRQTCLEVEDADDEYLN